MDKLKLLVLTMMLSTGTMALTACEEGPLEEAGEEIDDAVDEVEDELD
jgi:hypothetical protein